MFIELTLFYSRGQKTRETHEVFVRTSKTTACMRFFVRTRKKVRSRNRDARTCEKIMDTHLPSASMTTQSCRQPRQWVTTQFILQDARCNSRQTGACCSSVLAQDGREAPARAVVFLRCYRQRSGAHGVNAMMVDTILNGWWLAKKIMR